MMTLVLSTRVQSHKDDFPCFQGKNIFIKQDFKKITKKHFNSCYF